MNDKPGRPFPCEGDSRGSQGAEASLRPRPTTGFPGHVSSHHALLACDVAQQANPRSYPIPRPSLDGPFDDRVGIERTPAGGLYILRAARDKIRARVRSWLTGLHRADSGR